MEDTDVGFPGPEHHIAERDWAMKVPDGDPGACWRWSAACCRSPASTTRITKFLAPTFAGSHLYDLEPSTGTDWIGLIIGALIAVAGISIAYRIWVAQARHAARLQRAAAALHTFLFNKWYFDELIDLLVVRPVQWLGRFAESVLERGVIAGGVTGGTVGGRARRLGRRPPRPDRLPALLRRGR